MLRNFLLNVCVFWKTKTTFINMGNIKLIEKKITCKKPELYIRRSYIMLSLSALLLLLALCRFVIQPMPTKHTFLTRCWSVCFLTENTRCVREAHKIHHLKQCFMDRFSWTMANISEKNKNQPLRYKIMNLLMSARLWLSYLGLNVLRNWYQPTCLTFLIPYLIYDTTNNMNIVRSYWHFTIHILFTMHLDDQCW